MPRARLFSVWILLALWLANLSIAPACQVPVFRYALERWAPAEYLVSVLPDEGGLTDAEKKVVELLSAAPQDAQNPVNLTVQVEPPAPGARGPAQLVLRYPRKPRDPRQQTIWQAPLTLENVQALLDSPARQELRRRLLAGESAVWLLVESGDQARDNAAAEALATALAEAQTSLKLPTEVTVPEDAAKRPGQKSEHADALRSDLPLKIEFSVMRLKRSDPAETALLAMLTHLEDDLGGLAHEPMFFPVFGRGRVLEPLVGKGINRENAMEHSAYLCGACSCEVKDQNPGTDLLLAANWEPVDTTPQLEIVSIVPQVETPVARRSYPITAAAGVLLLGCAAWVLRRKTGVS